MGRACLQDLGEEPGQVIGVMVNVAARLSLAKRFWRHMDSAHPHRMRGREIAGVVFEHGGGFGVNACLVKHHVKGGALGLCAILLMVGECKLYEKQTDLFIEFSVCRNVLGGLLSMADGLVVTAMYGGPPTRGS